MRRRANCSRYEDADEQNYRMSFTEIVAENEPADAEVVSLELSFVSSQFSVRPENQLWVARLPCFHQNVGTFRMEAKNAGNPPMAHFKRLNFVGCSAPLGPGALRRHC